MRTPRRFVANRLPGRKADFFAHIAWQLEGINNKIKVIKRMAYGYRDRDCFCLKIKAAFPGNP